MGSNASRFIKHSSLYALGNILRQVAGFIMLPIYTRYLTPADYGIVGLLVFSLSLLEIIFGARLGNVLPKFYHSEKSQEERNKMLSTAWVLTAAISLVSTIILMLFSQDFSVFLFKSEEYSLIIILFLVNLITMGIEHHGLTFIRIQEKPVLYLTLGVLKLLMQLTLNIVLIVVYEMGVLGVIITSVVSYAVFAVGLSFYSFWHTKLKFSYNKAKELLSFTWPLWVGSIGGLYVGSSNRYYIGNFSSIEEVGLYELAGKFSEIIMFLIWVPITQFWQVESFKHYVADRPAPDIYRNMHKVVCILLVLFALGISLFSKPVIIIISDKLFWGSSEAVVWLVYGGIFYAMVQYVNFSFEATSNTKIIRDNQYITVVVATCFFILLIPKFGLLGAAAGMMFTRIVEFLIAYHRSKSIYDLNLDIGFMSLLLLISFIISFGGYYITNDNIIYEILLRMAVFIFACLLTLVFIRQDSVMNKISKDLLTNIPYLSKIGLKLLK